ncbi:MAG: sugar phosphate isomerase/epimerase [Gemmatales bacterium]|nr:sugar phosphate isomerase/epimerase [Gemmatales bacterium]MDW8386442.1 TIM barrel protein [Gemmatales bacterium]
MKDPWQKYMQIGIVHPMLFPECLGGEGPLLDTLRTICLDPFFEAVDVGVMHDNHQRAECAALLRDTRMTVTFCCQPVQLLQGLDINHADNAERQRAVEAILRLIPQARELGASRFAVMSGKNVPPEKRRLAIERLIESLERICQAAWEEAGMPVVLEIFDYDVDKKALIGPCSLAAEVAGRVRADFPSFGLMHDLSHIYLCHETPSRHFPAIREHLVAVHLGNSVSRPGHPLFGDTHPPFGIEGGDCDVPQVRDFLKTLFDIGFLRPGRRPVVGFEVRTPKGTDPHVCIANVKRTLAQAWYDW